MDGDVRSLSRPLPILAVAILCGLLVTAFLVVSGGPEEAEPTRRQPAAEPQTVSRNLHPDPRLSPQEVVDYQMTVLRRNGSGESGIRKCFRFASPLNRAATGPISRFITMIRSRPYNVMIDAVDALVGKAIVRGDRAMVLVTLVDPRKEIRVFRFFLSKQRESPYAGCWMTDAVSEAIFEGPAASAGSPTTPAVGI